MFARLRHLVGVRQDANQVVYATNHFAELFVCIWCMSRWVAAVLVIATLLLPNVMVWVLLVFAASSVAILWDRWT